MTTFVYSLPVVNGSEDTWGETLNTNWTNIGTFLGALDSAELAKLDGLTASTADLNKLDGLTASTADLNKLDGLTASQAELNKMDGCTATTTELNYTDGVTSNIQTQLNAKAASARTISAGGGLSGGGNLTANRTISHSDTSAQGSVNNSGNTVIQDISVDTYGHVTSIGSKALSIPAAYTQPTSTGSVGTYAFLQVHSSADNVARAAGSSLAGSSLRYTNSGSFYGSTPSGTWRLMGQILGSLAGASNTSVWLRIS